MLPTDFTSAGKPEMGPKVHAALDPICLILHAVTLAGSGVIHKMGCCGDGRVIRVSILQFSEVHPVR